MKLSRTPNVISVPIFKDNYVWLYPDGITDNSVIIVDPGDAQPVLDYCKKNHLTPSSILITHIHYDHVSGIPLLTQHNSIPVYGPATSIKHYYPQAHPIADQEQLRIGKHIFDILAIPGHTMDHIAYYCKNTKTLFCGDTLFSAGCGFLFEGSPEQMFQSLSKLAQLPDDTVCYCVHEYTLANLAFAKTVEPNNEAIDEKILYCQKQRKKNASTLPTTLAEEKAFNPFLRCHEPTVITAAENFAGKVLSNPAAVFAILRFWKNTFSS